MDKILRMVRFLAIDGGHVAKQFLVTDFGLSLAHRGNEVALEIRDVNAQCVDKHGEFRAGPAPNAVARRLVEIKLQRANGEPVHRVFGDRGHSISSLIMGWRAKFLGLERYRQPWC